MLHPIKVPSCYPALEWLVQLQRELLAKLCDPTTTAVMVTPEWVAAIRPGYSGWLQKFTGWTHNKRGLLSAMQTIASATTTQKKVICTYFETSQAFPESFDSRVLSPTVISAVQSLGEDGIISCLRILLEAFYEIALQRGLPVDAHGSAGHSFDRSQFVEIFKKENFDQVCPFCDGDMNGPQVDHWLPKSKYPALSCHPRNLVPVCHRCNSRECKGEKSPITLTNHRPFDDWFHPYERPAHRNLSVKVTGSQVSMINEDLGQQARLNNLDSLLKLTPRWSEEYKRQANCYLKQLADKVLKKRIKPIPDEVLDAISEWLEEITAEETQMPHSIIRRAVLEQLNNVESPDFRAWLQHAEDTLA